MKIKLLKSGAALAALCILCLAAGCISENEKAGDVDKIGIVVTLLPQAEFAEKIGGDKVNVMVMVPPGASPHTYEPTPSQLAEVSNAKIYAKVGSGVEFEIAWMDKIKNTNKKMKVVDCSGGIELIDMEHEHTHEDEEHEHHEDEEHEHHHVGKDPHIWLSPKNARIMVENIYQGLIEADPENKEYYKKNKEDYLSELYKLDSEIETALENKKHDKIMVYHPAWGYFCRDYGLEQMAIEKEGKEPTPKGIASVIKQAKENNIKIIFASPEFSTQSAQTIANEINGEVVLLSPLEKNYTENLRKAAGAFSRI